MIQKILNTRILLPYRMQKNKLLLLILLLQFTAQAITIEQFKALSEDRKWDLYCDHNAYYRRIFKNKEYAIAKLEQQADWWQTVAISSICLALVTTVLGITTAYVAIKNPRAPQ